MESEDSIEFKMRPEFKIFLEDLKKHYLREELDREELYRLGKPFFPLSKDEEEEMLKLAPDIIVKILCDVLEKVPGSKGEVERLRKKPADSNTARELLGVIRGIIRSKS